MTQEYKSKGRAGPVKGVLASDEAEGWNLLLPVFIIRDPSTPTAFVRTRTSAVK
jgi:hypothetical protein